MTDFRAGDDGNIGGVDWRVVQGRKSPSDLRLDIRAAQFVPVGMSVGFLFADFFCQNERTLAAEGYLAPSVAMDPGLMFINYCRGAQRLGWETAQEQLAADRLARRPRKWDAA